MISTRELKTQIDEIADQQLTLSDELQQIKNLLQKLNDQVEGNNQSGGSNNSSQSNNSWSQTSNQSGDQSGDQSGNQSGNHFSEIANDFLKLKQITNELENNVRNYISSSTKSNQPLTEEDVINLILCMMNGMIDWTIDFVTNSNNSSNP